MARLYKLGREIGGAEVGTNSIVFASKDLVSIKSGFLDKTAVWDKIEWLCKETVTMASDNQTVEQVRVNFIKVDDYTELELPVVDWTIAQADIGSLYDTDSSGNCDADAGTPSQLRLIRVITSTLGVFQRAK